MKSRFCAAAGLLLLIAPAAVAQTGSDISRVACDFRALTAAQRDAQTDAHAQRIPALLGPIDGEMRAIPLNGVYISDAAINRKVMVQQVFARRTPNKSLEVLTRIVNCTDYPLQLLGRTSFMDANTFPTEEPSAWKTVFLQPRSVSNYQEVSVGGSSVTSYLIELISNR